MSNFFSFITGTFFGMYVAQAYKIPNIKNSATLLLSYLESLEKKNKEDKKEE
jgi:hypothetical protein